MSQEKIRELWEKFGDIPIDKDDNIEESFTTGDITWEKGTDRFEIWHWFDEQYKDGLYKEIFP